MTEIEEMGDVSVAQIIRDSVSKQDRASLATCLTHFASFCFKELDQARPFPEIVFDTAVQLMSARELLEMEGSHELLLLFEYDWAHLTEVQKQRLLEAMRGSFGRFADWMSQFVISELLGEYYCNADSFRVLCELKANSSESARTFVPHGFEHIARQAKDASLRNAALAQLQSMLKDPSSDVQNEVLEALANVHQPMRGPRP